MLRLLLIPAALLAMVAGSVVWSNRSQGNPADFSFVNRGENKTLDLGVMSWDRDIRLAYAMWEGLYTLDPVRLKPIAGAAGRIDLNADQTVYTFHIRDNARWSNADALTAKDYVFGWRRLIEQPAEYSYLFEYIKGAKAYARTFGEWKNAIAAGRKLPRPDFGSVGIEVLDGKMLRVTLEHPLPFFPAVCAFPPFYPQYEPCMKRFEQKDPTGTYVASYDQAFTRPPNLVTNGPYQLTEWSFKRRLRLTANPYYWDGAHVLSKTVDQLYAADDPLAQYRIYESNNADWLADVDADLAADLKALGRTDLKLFPAFGTYFYAFNCQSTLPRGIRNPLADRRVRRALVMAIDKAPIVQNVTRTGEPIATTYIPRGVFPAYHSPPGLPYDPAQARRLLAEAGYPDGAGFPHLTILFNNDFPMHADIAQVLRRQWQEKLGIEMDLEGVELKSFAERVHNHEFAVGRASWYGDYDDPSTFTDVYKSTSQNNDPDWRRSEYDALLKQAEFERDAAKRFELLSRAENLLLEDAPIMPLYQYVGRYLVHDNVQGVSLDARQTVMLQAVRVIHTK